MKKLWMLCVIAFLSTVSLFVISYVGGRAGMPVSIAGLPAQIVPHLINTSCIGCLLLLLLLAMVKRKHVGATVTALLLSTAFAAAGFLFPPARLFKLGFRERLQARLSVDELRQIARVFQQNAPPDGKLPGPGKRSLWTEQEHAPFWTALTNSTSLGKLDSFIVIYKQPDNVELSWGGALIGHWGVRIKNAATATDGDIAPGIATFISD
jgi:hypothetical protein